MDLDSLFRTSAPVVIPGVLEATAWRDADARWLAAVEAELARGTEPNTVELGDGRVETTIEILRTGEFVHRRDGRFRVDGRVLSELVANFHADLHMQGARGSHEVFITIGHLELDGAPAAGWITDLWRAGDSLFARVRLNRKTVELIREGEYKYFSSTFHVANWTDEAGRIVGAKLHSGAITNFPFIRGMAPFQLSALLGDAGVDEMTLTPELVKQLVTEQVGALRKDLTAEVGTAVKAQLADAIKDLPKQLAETLKADASKATSSGGPDLKTLSETVGRLEGTLQKALDDNKRLSDSLDSTTEAIEARDVLDLVSKGVHEGKLSAGEVPGFGTPNFDPMAWMKADGRFASVANLRAHIAKAPVVVKLTAAGGPGPAPGSVAAAKPLTLSDDEAKRIGFKDAADFERLYELHESLTTA